NRRERPLGGRVSVRSPIRLLAAAWVSAVRVTALEQGPLLVIETLTEQLDCIGMKSLRQGSRDLRPSLSRKGFEELLAPKRGWAAYLAQHAKVRGDLTVPLSKRPLEE